ncbi:MAG: transporter substrate-binding domain-containing protein [Alteromonadaceae bacterium]|nr:transporter substrate-binding domain-containing protein [Alteromonadaceae bacterium]
MKSYRKYFIFYILLFSPMTIAETLSVLVFEGSNPPYTITKNGENSGIFVDLFLKLSQVTDLNFDLQNYPAARGLQEFDMGRVDIEPGVNEKWRQNTKVLGLYSIPYNYSREVIVFKKANAITVNNAQDLYGKSIGIVRGYSYPKFDDAFNKNLITKVSNRSEKLLLKQLQADRIKYIFIGYRTIKYYMQQNPQYRNIVIGDTVSQVEVKLRIHPNKAYLLPTLNKGLATLLKNGDIDKIYSKYQ